MTPRRPSSISRLLTWFSIMAALLIAVCLIPLVVLDWEHMAQNREAEVQSGYQFARSLVQERLASARLLAETSARQAQPGSSAPTSATVLVLSNDGTVLSSSSGRTIPRLASLMGRLRTTSVNGTEIDDRGTLVAVGSYPLADRVVVAALPFGGDDVDRIQAATLLDASFYAGRNRVATTVRDTSGQLAAAVPMPAGDWETLVASAGQVSWSYDEGLLGQPYMQILVPLFGLDGVPIGAYGVGRAWSEHARLIAQWSAFWLGVYTVAVLLMLVLCWLLRRRLAQPVQHLGQRLALLSAGQPTDLKPLYSDWPELEVAVRHINDLAASQAALAHKNELLSENLIQSQTLAALGQLAAGVAHDLNNPLTTIMGLADIIQMGTQDADTRRDLTVIRRQAERSGRIVRGLLGFARRQKADPQWVSLNDLIAQTLELLAYQARITNILSQTQLDPDLPLTWADPSQLQQVLFNVINNAMQAMAGANSQGQLCIASSWSPPTAGAPHGRIVIQVRDDGPGIPEEVLPRLFQAYFTTKGPNDGTGLGLAIAFNIVRRHSGRIWAENNPDKGASFFVELPVTPEPPQGVAAQAGTAAATRPSYILLADSDPQTVSLLAQILRRGGHLLSTAGDGLLARSKMEMEEFDLVLCGLGMSRLSGRQLYTWACTYRPEMANRFIFVVHTEISDEDQAFLEATRALVLRPPFQDSTVKGPVNQALHPS